MKKILSIVGARPQFIKAAVVSRALRGTPGVCSSLVHTGQHYDQNMSDIFFEEMESPQPDYRLGIGSGSHGVQTGKMLAAIEEILLAERPDRVVVYGDTNSTLAGALAAAKLHFPLAHVEAGLRSFNRRMPEEINRVLTDHAADCLLVPTNAAVTNLRREGIPDSWIHLVGDVMMDAAVYYEPRARQRTALLEELAVSPGGYVLATLHRAENTDDHSRLGAVLGGLTLVSDDMPVVLPIHPRTRAALASAGCRIPQTNALHVIDPVGYLDMLALELHAAVIVTDSGGVQKEAYFHRVPCVTLRDETEWIELVELGWNRLVSPTDARVVAAGVLAALGTRGRDADLYGAGHAGEAIVTVLTDDTT